MTMSNLLVVVDLSTFDPIVFASLLAYRNLTTSLLFCIAHDMKKPLVNLLQFDIPLCIGD